MADLILNIPRNYEPKLKNRWLLKFPEEFNIHEFCLSKTSRPSITYSNNNIVRFIQKFILKPKWNNILIELRDFISPSSTQLIWGLLESKNKFTYNLELLDPTGVIIEHWLIKDCEIVSTNFDEINYSHNKLVTITIIVKPKSVKLLF